MENMKQKLILVDENGKQIGIASRQECHRGRGKLHWGFVVLVSGEDGRLILARRSKQKSCGANLWDASIVSHVLPKETLEQAAKRRARQELGIVIFNIKNIGAFVYQASYGKYSENEYCSVLTARVKDMPNPNPEEISEIRLLTLDQLINDIKREASAYAPWLSIPVERFKSKL